LPNSRGPHQIQINKNERLTFDSFEEKKETSNEIIVTQFQRRKDGDWETIAMIKLLRNPDGTYKQIPENK
jgi:hypothetical protein